MAVTATSKRFPTVSALRKPLSSVNSPMRKKGSYFGKVFHITVLTRAFLQNELDSVE